MNKALDFLNKVPAAIIHLQPLAGLSSLRAVRLGQILTVLDPEYIHYSTRLLVLAKPSEDTEEGRVRALELGRQLIEGTLRKQLPAPHPLGPKDSILKARQVPILGPFLLPCQLRGDISELYKKSYYRPFKGEPKMGTPAVVLFVFVSDC